MKGTIQLLLIMLLPYMASAFGFFGGGPGGFQFNFDEDEEDDPRSRGGHSKKAPEPVKPLCGPNMYACPSDRWIAAHYKLGEVKCVKDPKDCPCVVPGEKKCMLGPWYVCSKADMPCPPSS